MLRCLHGVLESFYVPSSLLIKALHLRLQRSMQEQDDYYCYTPHQSSGEHGDHRNPYAGLSSSIRAEKNAEGTDKTNRCQYQPRSERDHACEEQQSVYHF